MNKKEIKTIRAEVSRITTSIDSMNERFNKVAARIDSGRLEEERGQKVLAVLDDKITNLQWQKATIIYTFGLIGVDVG